MDLVKCIFPPKKCQTVSLSFFSQSAAILSHSFVHSLVHSFIHFKLVAWVVWWILAGFLHISFYWPAFEDLQPFFTEPPVNEEEKPRKRELSCLSLFLSAWRDGFQQKPLKSDMKSVFLLYVFVNFSIPRLRSSTVLFATSRQNSSPIVFVFEDRAFHKEAPPTFKKKKKKVHTMYLTFCCHRWFHSRYINNLKVYCFRGGFHSNYIDSVTSSCFIGGFLWKFTVLKDDLNQNILTIY